MTIIRGGLIDGKTYQKLSVLLGFWVVLINTCIGFSVNWSGLFNALVVWLYTMYMYFRFE